MAKQHLFSLRDIATGKINDFFDDEGFDCSKSLKLLLFISGVICTLKNEGIPLSPSVMLTTDLQPFLLRIPGSRALKVGEIPFDSNVGVKILKSCAYFAKDGWSIYIERVSAEHICFGVFSLPARPGALSLEDTILLLPDTITMLLRKTSQTSVRIIGCKGNALTMKFTTSKDDEGGQADSIVAFAKRCCSGLAKATNYDRFIEYFSGLLNGMVERCHGTILVCVDSISVLREEGFKDSVIMDAPIDFFSAFDSFVRENSADSLIALRSIESLLEGIFQGDGMIAFSPMGQLSAYRIFIAATAALEVDGDGGARRRAFEGLSPFIGKGLSAALFRSQDGLTLLKG